MTKTATVKRISGLHVQNPGDMAWQAQQAQVDADIEGLSRDADADRLVAEMDASGVEPRKKIEHPESIFAAVRWGIKLVSDDDTKDPGFQQACQLVGEFFYRFALVENELDAAMEKILILDQDAKAILAATLDFSKKINVVFAAEFAKAAKPSADRKKLLEKTIGRLRGLNDNRNIMAHCPFSPRSPSGVIFRRVVAKTHIAVKNLEWDEAKFKGVFADAEKLASDLRLIVEGLVPYRPSLDFSDPRNFSAWPFGLRIVGDFNPIDR